YPRTKLTLAQACNNLPPAYRDLQHLGRGLFGPADRLYQHQWESLESVIVGRREPDGVVRPWDIVATTGTGSGKTQCFLLPLLAELARESATWPACPPPPAGRRWWNQRAQRNVGQWSHSLR